VDRDETDLPMTDLLTVIVGAFRCVIQPFRFLVFASYVTGNIQIINPLNAELNPFYHLLALLGAHHILHISRVRVKQCSDENTSG
jgi:hypothetical protein